MKVSVHQDVLTGRFTALLLGGEFSNCEGSGDTEENAISSLKLLLRVKRKNNGNSHKK